MSTDDAEPELPMPLPYDAAAVVPGVAAARDVMPIIHASLSVYEMSVNGSNAAMLNEILDNPEADRAISKAAVARAIANGVAPDLAMRLYGNTIERGDTPQRS